MSSAEGACSSAPCLNIKERNKKNNPVESENDVLTSASVNEDANSWITIEANPTTTAVATEIIIAVIPRRKLFFAPSKVKGNGINVYNFADTKFILPTV